jgi:16S rRNA (uracil1498-N3)-methyltransferase
VISESTECDIKLILTTSGDRKTLPEALAGSKASSIAVMVGPEGDFTPDEVETARTAGFVPVSLGGNVLRVETAAVAAASYINLTMNV